MVEYVVGIDEAGRGCLAGPVTAAAVAMPRPLSFSKYLPKQLRQMLCKKSSQKFYLRDSKKLNKKQREAVYQWLQSQEDIKTALAVVSSQVIDKINISQAANLAATRALDRLYKQINIGLKLDFAENMEKTNLTIQPTILLDGGLKLTGKFKEVNYQSIIRGDSKYTVIKLASILAKVSRDQLMEKEHKRYPHYGFDENVGYGTNFHKQALLKYGVCPLHRLTFVKNIFSVSK